MAESDGGNLPVQLSKRETLDLDRIISTLRSTAGQPFERELLSGLTQSMRENLVRRLAHVNKNVTPEDKIPGSRILSALTALVGEPIVHFDYMTVNAGTAEFSFNDFIQKLADVNSRSLKTLKLNVVANKHWLINSGSATLRLASLQELRVPNFVLGEEDLQSLTTNLSNLEILDCKIDATVAAQTVACNLERLGKLRKFYFDVVRQGEYHWIPFSRLEDGRCFAYCQILVEKLPSLSTIGCDLTFPAIRKQFYPEREVRMCHVLDDHDARSLSSVSRLQNLIVQRPMHVRQAEWHSENAVSLCVVGLLDKEEWKALRRLRKLKYLFTVDCSPAGRLAKRVQKTLMHFEFIQKYLLEEDPELNTRILMTMKPLPASLDQIMELHFSDLPENMSRMVEVMTSTELRKAHVLIQNPRECCRLEDATKDLKSRQDVAPELKQLEFKFLQAIDQDQQNVLAEFCQVISAKARRLEYFHSSYPFQK